MYSRIVVPLDGSSVAEQVLPYARFLSEKLKVPVELLAVIDLAAIAVHSNKSRNVGRLLEEIRHASEAYLERIRKSFAGTPVTCSVENGKPEEVIIEKAGRDEGTLLAMATHGRSGMSRWLLGSVAEKVLRTTTNPLLLVRSGAGGKAEGKIKFENIVVPLDTSALAETVLPTVKDLARRLNLQVILAHVYELPLSTYYGAEDYYKLDYKKLAAQFEEEARKYLEGKVEALKKEGLEKVSSVCLEGSAAQEIIAFVRGKPNSLVAMGTHGSGLGRWVLGSVTERVVRHSDDPVLVLRAG